MQVFPYTKKKFDSMPVARRHKWIASWLKGHYLHLLKNQIDAPYIDLLFQNYQRINSWLKAPAISFSFGENEVEQLECLGDLYHKHQILSGRGVREYDLLPSIKQGDTVTNEPWTASVHYKVALDNFRSAFNVGSIFRICDSVGFEEVLLGGYSPGKSHSGVVKTAMGATNWIPEVVCADLQKSLLNHQLDGYQIIGLETIDGASNIDSFLWPQKAVIVLGNEEQGISQSIMQRCTKFIQIPMFGRKNSINVANAFSIVAYSASSTLIKENKKQ